MGLKASILDEYYRINRRTRLQSIGILLYSEKSVALNQKWKQIIFDMKKLCSESHRLIRQLGPSLNRRLDIFNKKLFGKNCESIKFADPTSLA